MVKQALSLPCACGQAITFPEGEIKTKCSCGAVWECGPEGYWYSETPITLFAPILANLNPKNRPSRYEKYMKRRNESKGRKAGRRC